MLVSFIFNQIPHFHRHVTPQAVLSNGQARAQLQKMQETASQFSQMEQKLKCQEHAFLGRGITMIDKRPNIPTSQNCKMAPFDPFDLSVLRLALLDDRISRSEHHTAEQSIQDLRGAGR